MADPRTIGIRVYFNEGEVDEIREVARERGLSDSATIRFLMLQGLKSMQTPDFEPTPRPADRLIKAMEERSQRFRMPKLKSAS